MAGRGKSDRHEEEARRAQAEQEQALRERLEALRSTIADASADAQRTLAERRVDCILGMMVEGEWVNGSSHRLLAKEWGLSDSRVMAIAAEASRALVRYVREDKETRETMRARIITSLDRIAKKAEQRGSFAGYRDALEANVRLAQLYGFLKPDGATVKEESPFADWTEAEKEHFAETGERPTRFTNGNGHDPDGAAARH